MRPLVISLASLFVALALEAIGLFEARLHYMETGVLRSLDSAAWLFLRGFVAVSAVTVGVTFRRMIATERTR
jgi:hypothetical protein